LPKSSDYATNLETAKMIQIVERWDRIADQRGDAEKRKELWTILYVLDGDNLKRDQALEYLRGYRQTDEVLQVLTFLGGSDKVDERSLR
jgi:hypothetical protein